MDLHTLPPQTLVHITLQDTSYEGTLLPSEDEYIVLKLSSGYNIGIAPSHIQSYKILAEAPATLSSTPTTPVENPEDLPELTILHTGGTIASKVDYKTGAVIADFSPEALLGLFPELADYAHISSKFLGNMFSDDLRFSHCNTIATTIAQQAQQGIRNFIVTSGTDNLHYVSAALSFMLKDFPIGVLVVGSQRSSDRGSSDAAINLISATQFLTQTSFRGVGVCMHESSNDTSCYILPGVNVRKMHSSRRDAFKPLNTTSWARVIPAEEKIIIQRPFTKYAADEKIPSQPELLKEDLKLGLCYAHPNMYAQELSVYNDFDGLVLVGTGLGHFPLTKVDKTCQEHTKILQQLKDLIAKIPVAMTSQTLYGRVHLNVYAPARTLRKAGILGHLNLMSPETTFMKLAWLLSNHPNNIPFLFHENIVGEQEISENTINSTLQSHTKN